MPRSREEIQPARWKPLRFSGLASGKGAVLLLLLAALLPYLNSLGNGFHWDDFHHLVENPAIRDLAGLPRLFTDPATFSRDPGVEMYRPLLMASYALNYALGGLRPSGYHAVSLGLHAGCVLLFYFLLLRLLGDAAGRGAALAAALLFAVHPVNSQTVNYISTRSELLASFLLLLALHLYPGAEEGRRPWRRATVAAVALFLALLAKSTALALVPLLLAWELLFPAGGQGTAWHRRLLRLTGPAAAAALYVWLSRAVIAQSLGQPVRPLDVHLATQARVFWRYLRLMLFPAGLNVFADVRPATGLFQPSALLAIIGLAALALLLLGLAQRLGSRPAVFFALWIFATLAPASLIPLNVLASEQRLYLPLAGLLGLGASWAVAAAGSRRWGAAAGRPAGRALARAWVAVALILAAATLLRNRVWLDEQTLWEDAARKSPLSARPRVNLGLASFREGHLDAAAEQFRRALELEPGDLQATINLGMVHLRREEHEQAAALFLTAHRDAPQRVDVAVNLALALQGAGRAAESVPLLKGYRARWPRSRDLLNTLGQGYLQNGQAEAALECFELTLRLAPGYAHAASNSGLALSRMGRTAEAEAAFRRALEIDPGHFEGWANLGTLYYRQGRFDRALEAYQQALAIRPADAKLLHNLRLCYKALGRPAGGGG